MDLVAKEIAPAKRYTMHTPSRLLLLLTALTALTINRAMADERYTIGMSTSDDRSTAPIYAQRVKVESLVVGGLASTRFDIVFYNPNDRVLEGTFTLPLAPGWQLGKFELDINGRLRAAVPVPKSTGRKAFNAVKRRGVDPALVEQRAENLFTARVYPFAVRGTRRVVITLDHTLQPEKGGEMFEMPYTFEKSLEHLSVELRVVERPVADASMEGLEGVTFIPGRNESVWRYEKRNAALRERVKVHLPKPPRQSLIVAKDSAGAVYAAFLRAAASPKPAPKPTSISVVWDASGSAGKGNINAAKELLQQHLAWVKNCAVELLIFNIEASKPIRFSVKKSQCDALMRAIDSIQYDGGTDLNCVPWEKLKGDEVILFSDGLQSSPQKAELPRAKGKLHTINIGTTPNARWLQHAALAHGGQFVDLASHTADAAHAILTAAPLTVLWWRPDDGPKYHAPTLLGSQGAWLFGTANKPPQSVTIALRPGAGKTTETSLRPDSNSATWHDADIAALLRRNYAQQEVARLQREGKEGMAETFARQHGVATEKTSLLVLEEVDDYVRYAIAPPAELKEQYHAMVQQNRLNQASLAKDRIEDLARRSDEQSRWWRGEIVPPAQDFAEMTQHPGMLRGHATHAQRPNLFMTQSRSMAPAAEGAKGEVAMNLAAPANTAAQTAAPLHGSVIIAAWDSESPYLRVLEYANKNEQKATYYKLKKEYGAVPSFYLDAGAFFASQGDAAFAYQVLSNLLEIEVGSTELHRALAQALERLGRLQDAEALYRKITEDAAFEPQSFRDLALVCEAQGKLQEAINLLYKVATGDWEPRFAGVDLICMNELNGLLMRHGTRGLDLSAIDKRLIKQEPVDVRIVLTWSNDDTDVDLHVTLPDGEECYYGHRITKTNGKLSNDITQGYGPEEFMHRKGAKGEYLIRARLFADHTQSSVVPKYVRAVCYLHYGSPDEERHELAFRIATPRETVEVGSIQFE